MKKILITLLILSIVFGVLIRSVEVLNRNYLFAFDQGRDYLAVRSIVVDHKPTLIGSELGAGSAGFRGLFHGPFHYYFLAIPFFLSRGDPHSGILLTYVYGLAVLILGFLLARRLFGTLFDLVAAALLSLSPPLISQSRFVWNSHGAPVFALISFYFIYRLAEGVRDPKYFFAASFSAAFIYNFQTAIAIPISLALLLYCFFILKIRALKHYLALILGFTVALSPMILFEIRHQFMGLKGVIEYILNPQGSKTIQEVADRLIGQLGAFIHNTYDTFPKQILLEGKVILILLLSLSVYFVSREKNKPIKKFILFLISIPFITFFILSFLKNLVYQYYLLHLVLVYIFLLSYIIYSSISKKKHLITFFAVVFVAVSFAKAYPEIVSTFNKDYVDFGGTAKIKGKIEAIDYIYKDAGDDRFCMMVFSPPVYTYPYDYLIAWWGEAKYHYIPCKEKKDTFYLLIEPDPSKTWSYKGWLETVIKEGTVIYEKELPSGFIVQKRFND